MLYSLAILYVLQIQNTNALSYFRYLHTESNALILNSEILQLLYFAMAALSE